MTLLHMLNNSDQNKRKEEEEEEVLKEKKKEEKEKEAEEKEKPKEEFKDGRCPTCGKSTRRRKRYFLIFAIVLVVAYFTKSLYEKAFKKAIIIGLLNDFLNMKAVSHLNLSETTKANLLYIAEIAASSPREVAEDKPGILAAKKGMVGKHPITLIPGIANTNLELWKTTEASNSFFRKKIWGSHSTVTFMLHNKQEWFASMKLDEETGLDPEASKVRAASGLESSDFGIPGLWFWWKIVENLSHLGYDAGRVHFAAFDWRLGMEEMEIRDGYFTKLKIDIEHQKAVSKEKAVIIAHSLGSLVFHYFMQWVTEKDKTWVDQHIHAISYIGAPLLGAPKSISCLLTGEAQDTAQMGLIQYAIVELLFGKEQRKDLFKTWTSALYLLPKGGSAFWEGSPPADNSASPCIVHLSEENKPDRHLTLEEIFQEIGKIVSPHNKKVLQEILDPTSKCGKWSNPLLSPLPHAPNLTIYSMYGISKTTERSYHLIQSGEEFDLNKNHTDLEQNLYHGIYNVDGDGTVPLMSCGYMGHSGWKEKKLNPSQAKTVNKEYIHKPPKSILDVRGGSETAQHVNILGNFELITDLLTIASGSTVKERITSDLPKIAKKINEKREHKE